MGPSAQPGRAGGRPPPQAPAAAAQRASTPPVAGAPSAGPPVTGAAFEHLPSAAAIVDLRDAGGPALLGANRALRTLTGYSSAELERVAIADIAPALGEIVARLRDGGAEEELETECVDAGGRHVAVTVRAAPLELDGDPRRAAIVQIDDGAHRREIERALRKSERRLEDMADNVSALIYLKWTDGRYIFINRHFEQLFGLRREEAQGRTDFDLWPEEIASAYTANDRTVLAAGAPMEFEEPITWGTWLSLKFPLFDDDGVPYGVGGISTDISDRRRAEAAIREARDEAERANLAKSEFLSRMSHELRTPLNSILGFGQLLQMERLPAAGGESAERIVQAGRHLLSLINEVLEISRIESGVQDVALEPVHACDPLNEAFDLVRPLAAERGIDLGRDLHDGLYKFVRAEYQRLKQVLLNVLTNAVNYNHEGGSVRASFACAGEGRLRYLVADTGRGIAGGDLERIFNPFERLDADTTEALGTGLGLSLSRSLVESMGGAIGVESSIKGEGTVFFVELPLSEDAGRLEQAVLREEAQIDAACVELEAVTILYIEDNLANQDLVRRVLERAGGPALITALQGQLGIELAVQHRPAVILLDLHLPDIGGEEVLRRLRDDERTRAIPIVVLSADATPTQVQRLEKAGAAAYITKPLEIPSFVETVRGAVRRGR